MQGGGGIREEGRRRMTVEYEYIRQRRIESARNNRITQSHILST